MSDEEKKYNNLPVSADGIVVTDASSTGGAFAAGIRKGDIIRKINDVTIESGADIQEQVTRFKPGDKVNVTFERNSSMSTVAVMLKNSAGNYDIVKADVMMDKLGADLISLSSAQAKTYGIAGGVIVRKIKGGAINDQTRMRDGFIITKANGKVVKSVDELRSVIGDAKTVKIEGVYPGYDETFEYPLDLSASR
jgi:S1-C subfamily serine protease